ncbi:MAG: hypothetical protein ISR96_11645 [Nitrospira sp.]|nr:hypothetical protein [Nitrospira sp.]
MKLNVRGGVQVYTICLALLVSCIFTVQASAVTDAERIRDLERRLEQSLKVIESLSSRVQQIEGKVGTVETRVQAAEVAVQDAGAPSGPSQADSILSQLTQLHGFADVGYVYSGDRATPADQSRGFTLGSFDIYLTPKLGGNTKALIELIFEYDAAGDIVLDLERLQLGYAFNDLLTLWAGRFHTPFGYWNTGFHHGLQIQTSAIRPVFVDFEDAGGILPVHGNGLWAAGGEKIGSGRATYDLYLTNGSRIKGVTTAGGDGELNANNVSNDNGNYHVGVNAGYEFADALDGLKLGAHWYRGKVNGYDPDDMDLSQSQLHILGAYAYFYDFDWEVIAEYYKFYNKNLTGAVGTGTSWAGFVQVARTIDNFTPYVRLEKADLDQMDNYFNQQASGQSYRKGAAGVKYDLNLKSVIKVELSHTNLVDRTLENYNEIRTQYAIRF